ncbi:uncharacterized protein LOC144007650 isoform X2 [Festucalex cinctus]
MCVACCCFSPRYVLLQDFPHLRDTSAFRFYSRFTNALTFQVWKLLIRNTVENLKAPEQAEMVKWEAFDEIRFAVGVKCWKRRQAEQFHKSRIKRHKVVESSHLLRGTKRNWIQVMTSHQGALVCKAPFNKQKVVGVWEARHQGTLETGVHRGIWPSSSSCSAQDFPHLRDTSAFEVIYQCRHSNCGS